MKKDRLRLISLTREIAKDYKAIITLWGDITKRHITTDSDVLDYNKILLSVSNHEKSSAIDLFLSNFNKEDASIETLERNLTKLKHIKNTLQELKIKDRKTYLEIKDKIKSIHTKIEKMHKINEKAVHFNDQENVDVIFIKEEVLFSNSIWVDVSSIESGFENNLNVSNELRSKTNKAISLLMSAIDVKKTILKKGV